MKTITLVAVLAALPISATAAEPATWGAELRLGSYDPRIGNATERHFYEIIYGSDQPLMLGLEFDRYLAHPLGLLGVFLRVGQWKQSGHARLCSDAAGPIDCTPDTVTNSVPAADNTTLLVVPLSLGAVYRFDLFKEKVGVPLVPYGKAGLDYFMWWASSGGKSSGKGGTTGYHGSLGLALNLDWIEPHGTDERHVFVDSFLFAEATWIKADGFGDRKRIDFSDQQFTFGLSLDFL